MMWGILRLTRAVAAVFVVVSAVGASGCLTTNPANNIRATGEALSVEGGRFRQGGTPIDEQDFYAIAGDKSAVATIRQQRASLTVEQIAWQATGLAGIVGIGADGGVMAAGIVITSEYGPIGLTALLPGVFFMTGSIVLVPLAYVWAAEAADAMYVQVTPTARAQKAADRYNDHRRKPSSSKRRRRQRVLRPRRRRLGHVGG